MSQSNNVAMGTLDTKSNREVVCGGDPSAKIPPKIEVMVPNGITLSTDERSFLCSSHK